SRQPENRHDLCRQAYVGPNQRRLPLLRRAFLQCFRGSFLETMSAITIPSNTICEVQGRKAAQWIPTNSAPGTGGYRTSTRRHGGCGCARRMSYENGRPSAAAVHASEKERSPRQGPGRRCSSATPRAKLSPTEVDTDIGCNAIVLLEPLAEASGDRHLAACA